MHASLLSRLTVVLLTLAASTVFDKPTEPGISETPGASFNDELGGHVTLQQTVSRALV
jgi:hypothetical protein